MPDYELSEAGVKVKILGSILNKDYTQLLMSRKDLDLHTTILLDKVQKKKMLSDADAKYLKKLKLIEGRKPNYFISSVMANMTNEKAQYIKNRGFKDEHYKRMILAYIEKFGSATRKELDKLLIDNLPHVLTQEQRGRKINNLISSLSSKQKLIKNISKSRKEPVWVLTNKDEKEE